MRAVLTPGHTFTHLSYLLHFEGEVVAAFTGGSLLIGSVGRPDLIDESATRALAHAQFHSAHRLAESAPDYARVLPTHGFGSFCSATQSDASSSTIGQERAANSALTSEEATFVEELIAGLDAYPTYCVNMGPRNIDAPDSAPDLSPPAPARRSRYPPSCRRRRMGDRSADAVRHSRPDTFRARSISGWTVPWRRTWAGRSPGRRR